MAQDPEHDGMEELTVYLDQDSYDYVAERAERAGRSVGDQLVYELKVNRGLCTADPHDEEARQRGQIMRRIFSHRPLRG